jgi:hypothetical protein
MKIKYKYRVHHLLESYPTEEDALFEIVSYLSEKGKLQEEWSNTGIKGAFSKKLEESTVEELLNSLVLQGCISRREGSGKRVYYKIIKTEI